MHHALDETDVRILQLLQQNAQLTNKEIAQSIGKSVTPIFERIKRLEKEGYIKQYVVVLNRRKIGLGLVAYAHVQLYKHDLATMAKFEDTVVQFPEVRECYRMAGEYDYLMNIIVRDMEEFNDFVIKKLSVVFDISSVQTYFVVDETKKSTMFNLVN